MIDKYKEELQKPIVKYGLIAVAILFVLQTILVPWLDWRGEVAQDWHSKSALTFSDDDLTLAIDELKAKTEALQKDLATLGSDYKSKGNSQVVLPSQIREISQSHNITINQVAVSELEDLNSTLSVFALNIEATGTVDELFRFVRALEQDDSLFAVQRLTVYNRRKQEMKIRMELRKYVEKA
ncbi:hypothetical protein [Alteromonas sp. a30]|uniref:hypothetical protein n=1 Tax=Alteromonas sp. a30 TaxID=2730917 RepID=UPI002282FD49|nr:hypothetical protein [Alteromonas sp. a30]MCY7294374.1 hypothetical protein [Alteromonas sp. a30]